MEKKLDFTNRKFLITLGVVILIIVGILCFLFRTKQEIDELTIMFMPSKSEQQILNAADPMKDILKTNLKHRGYKVDKVTLKVANDYEELEDSVANGKTDIAFMSGAAFAQMDEADAEIELTATRQGNSIESEKPSDWNKAKTNYTNNVSTSYQSLIATGPSKYGKKLSSKVNNGDTITLDELQKATWCTQGTGSSAGYVYPSFWLKENYNVTLKSIKNVITEDNFDSAMKDLAKEKCDIMTMYADARIDYQNTWQGENDIFSDVQVIGVTEPIMNDAIVVSKKSPNYTKGLGQAIKKSYLKLIETDKGKNMVEPYMHNGYVEANASLYKKDQQIQEQIGLK